VFRHRIKDLMIVNAIAAVALGVAIAFRDLLIVVLAVGLVVTMILGPLALVEIYLYRKKKGAWYRWGNPSEPRPRYQRPVDLPPREPRVPLPEAPWSTGRSRTRLFERMSPSDPVSRASLLLNVASRLEASGKTGAAAKIYQQILDGFAHTPEAEAAAHRLRSISERNVSAGRPRED
jgi:hypothetical protein